LPQGEKLNYIFQKYITHSLPISESDLSDKVDTINSHFNNFKRYNRHIDPGNCKYYEFGTGYDLVIPIGIRMFGFGELTCVDIRELVFPELINDSVKRLKNYSSKFYYNTGILDNLALFKRNNFRDVLKDSFKINYFAPSDARNTDLKSNSIDFILSNATMEHIPKKDLPDILKECYRILKPGGIMSNVIDYRDHWSFFDNEISVYNYLQYSEKEFDKINPSIMYQNRMRHKDYMKIISEAGFKILEEIKNEPDEIEKEQLGKISLNEYYKNKYNFDELGIKSSMLVLSK
jgi:SAM-dependent methyltransferase